MTEPVRVFLEGWPEGIMAKNLDVEQTPLHNAVYSGQMDVVRLMVELCPEALRGKNICGDIPLHVAAEWAHTDMVRLVVECWAEGKRATNISRRTPLRLLMMTARWQSLDDAQKKEFIAMLGRWVIVISANL
jgi:ankyrin repeat protein